ncbi:hypothetical protein [Streptomyces himalayensis]|uniref:hypothetical protein n=1 Tax=Streptomyces himalayensis TaxID=2820085 RepID=UPI001FE908AD|nr:hypothetical protein [Streptomyces himalayensis]
MPLPGRGGVERPPRLRVTTHAYDLRRAAATAATAAIIAGKWPPRRAEQPGSATVARGQLFLVVQGQTADVRTEHLAAFRA